MSPEAALLKQGRVGVLLINVGTPEDTTFWSVRRFLREFLSDRRVIEIPRLPWWLILNCFILNSRPSKSGKAYARIWNWEQSESPLKTFTRSQRDSVTAAFESQSHPEILVEWAMNYGQPAIPEQLARLSEAGCDRILLFPLFPQYSATTTAAAQDRAFDVFKEMRWQPAIRTVPAFFDDALYIDTLAHSLETHLQSLSWKPDLVLASYHSLPASYVEKGDPYREHCLTTTRLLTDRMGWDSAQLKTVFQSRFDKQVWLQPFAEETLCQLARAGKKNIVVLTPGFVSDCLETLEEVAMDMGESFRASGGRNFSAVPCLNDSDGAIGMLIGLIRTQLEGWIRQADEKENCTRLSVAPDALPLRS